MTPLEVVCFVVRVSIITPTKYTDLQNSRPYLQTSLGDPRRHTAFCQSRPCQEDLKRDKKIPWAEKKGCRNSSIFRMEAANARMSMVKTHNSVTKLGMPVCLEREKGPGNRVPGIRELFGQCVCRGL